MRYNFSTAAVLFLSGLASAQTFTDCDPTKKTCPANPGLGGTHTTDFTKGESKDWTLADGTTMTYGPEGAIFEIKTKTNAPTMAFTKFIMFGKVSVTMKAAPSAGVVSSFILESDDLDEIDWEWIGSQDNEAQSNFFGKGNTTTYDRGKTHPVSGVVSGFHTYEIDWKADKTTWAIDGTIVRTLMFADPVANGGKNYPQSPMEVKMGSWVGCADKDAAEDPKTKGTCEWAHGPADFSKAPFNMIVKSVTIQDYGCGGEYSYSDMSGSWQSIKSTGKCDGKANLEVAPSATSAKIPQLTAGANVSSGKPESPSGAPTPTGPGGIFATATGANGSTPTGANGTGLLSSPRPTGTAGSSAPTATSASAGNSSKPAKYGAIDVAVMALGLGLGYLVM
ncbi:hypothetical protein HYALB_00002856 [Hymenoscyphus albidus]|uniref:Crh-like protein n=1 Tax=Hymenoscyphus albidus TaxID=595503 RepID=A0A9N9PZ61_9HELO|nr:hypothetical protein HYALB_00002856 [Hymenoscyphus albidus]